MRDMKMAELQFEAPLARFDGEEWNDFNDFQTESDVKNTNTQPKMTSERKDTASIDEFSETFSGSLEDLVNAFDEKITKCFCSYEEEVEQIAPVQIRSQEEIMNDCQMWWTITGNFGNILPIDWSKSYARQLHEKSLNLAEKREQEFPDLDLSDDEELQQAFDMHSLIVSSLQQEPMMFTADEVINEIEGMMMEDEEEGMCMSADSTPTCSEILSTHSSELLHFKDNNISSVTGNDEQNLKNLSGTALNALYEELDVTIKDYSEVLIAELALRDELEYEKELKNQFISLLLSIQKKRRETQLERKKNVHKKQKAAANGVEPGTYLTTVIPFHPHQGPPTIEQLQIYIKILAAINEDSPTVPGLLTDYILKVLCPTT